MRNILLLTAAILLCSLIVHSEAKSVHHKKHHNRHHKKEVTTAPETEEKHAKKETKEEVNESDEEMEEVKKEKKEVKEEKEGKDEGEDYYNDMYIYKQDEEKKEASGCKLDLKGESGKDKKAKVHESAVEAVEEAVEEALEKVEEKKKEKKKKKKSEDGDYYNDMYIYDDSKKSDDEKEEETELAIEALENVEAERVLMEALNDDYNGYNNYDYNYNTANMDTGMDYLDEYISHDDDNYGLDMEYVAAPVKGDNDLKPGDDIEEIKEKKEKNTIDMIEKAAEEEALVAEAVYDQIKEKVEKKKGFKKNHGKHGKKKKGHHKSKKHGNDYYNDMYIY